MSLMVLEWLAECSERVYRIRFDPNTQAYIITLRQGAWGLDRMVHKKDAELSVGDGLLNFMSEVMIESWRSQLGLPQA